MPIHKIGITEINGFKLGNAEDKIKGTGCTVIVCNKGAVGGVDVRGGAPATRETDLLRSENTVDKVNAVVLSGGSAFGLESASGVMRELANMGIGFNVGDITVPIVCGASLFDLGVGDSHAFPDVEMGKRAVQNAFRGGFKTGNNGAGTGATVGKLKGMKRAMKTGLGTFACQDGDLKVGAIAAVNAVGDVYSGAGNIIAGLRSEYGNNIYGTIRTLKDMVQPLNNSENDSSNSSHNLHVSNNRSKKSISKEELTKVADALRSEFNSADLINNPETPAPAVNDAVETKPFEPVIDEPVASDAVIPEQKITAPDVIHQDMIETTTTEQVSPEHEPSLFGTADFEPQANQPMVQDDDLDSDDNEDKYGYNIPFNTTISCLITNADLNKSQANKLASILHDAYARAIKPVHGTMDGDTVFVLCTGECKVNYDAFAALCTDVMQYAIIDGAQSAKTAYGLPSASDL